MIIELRMKNFTIFKDEIDISFKANGYIKRYSDNVFQSLDHKITKSSCFYGPNNVGKTCLVSALGCLRHLMSGKGIARLLGKSSNFYHDDEVISLGITVLVDGTIYGFDCDYYEPKDPYEYGRIIHEKLSLYDEKTKQFKDIYIRNEEKNTSTFINDIDLSEQMDVFPRHNLFPYLFDQGANPKIDECVNILRKITDSILILSASHLSPLNTIQALKDNNPIRVKFIKNMIKSIDVDIDDFIYERSESNPIYDKLMTQNPGLASQGRESLFDECSLYSIHGEKKVESIVYDSKGTKEIIALSSYLVDALLDHKTLIIDEFDSGLHTRLLREIISMFNNETNQCSQLIVTLQDIELMDTHALFRKDQIYFMHREKNDDENIPDLYLYRLDSFTSLSSGMRSNTDAISRYQQGKLGAFPDPNLYEVMKGISQQHHE